MREVVRAAAFKRDSKKLLRQGKDLTALGNAILILARNLAIPQQYQDHPLKGNWRGRREMHIAPDWLLIYHIENDTVYLDRTGSHAELLKR